MKKHRRTAPRRRVPLHIEQLESRESPTDLGYLAATAMFGAGAIPPVKRHENAGGGGRTGVQCSPD